MNGTCTCGHYAAMWSWAGVCWYCGGKPQAATPTPPSQVARETGLRECTTASRRRSEEYVKFAARPNDYGQVPVASARARGCGGALSDPR